jgi:hypothetical protein
MVGGSGATGRGDVCRCTKSNEQSTTGKAMFGPNLVTAPATGGKAPPPPDAAGTLECAIRAINGLAVAFATFRLFADSARQDDFDRVLDDVGRAVTLGALTVTADGFEWKGSPVRSEHPAASRFAGRLFLHDIAGIRVASRPSVAEVAALFDIVSRRPEDVPEGASLAVADRGVSAIQLFGRSMLHESDPQDPAPAADTTIPGKPGDADVDDLGTGPASLAEALLREAGNDRTRLTELVLGRYLEAMDSADSDDVWAVEEVVHTFVDAFFYFPREYQAPIIENLLVGRDRPALRTFLDQFARHELYELAPLLKGEMHPLLLEYAKVAAEADGRLDELHILLTEVSSSQPIGVLIEHQVDHVLNASEGGQTQASGAVHNLSAQIAARATGPATASEVLAGLLESAVSPGHLTRRFRIWARKLAQAVEAEDLEAAEAWVSAVFDNPRLAGHIDDIAVSVGDVFTPEIAAHLTTVLLRTEMHEHEDGGLARVIPFMGPAIIERLADEPDQRRRRTMIEMLTAVARHDPGQLVRHLDDPRWHLVRNLVVALGRSHRPELAEMIEPVTRHSDPRVRREALRAIHTLGGAQPELLMAGMSDGDQSVRAVAATLIRSAPSEELVPLLRDLIDAGISIDAKCDIIALLGLLPSPEVRTILEHLADKRLSAAPAARALRHATRNALEQLQ